MGIKEDIHFLQQVGMPQLKVAFSQGGEAYDKLSHEYAPIAHRVFMALNKPSKSSAFGFFDNPHLCVTLDPFTVIGRLKSLGDGVSITDPEFWAHGDLIKSLCEWLLSNKEVICAEETIDA